MIDIADVSAQPWATPSSSIGMNGGGAAMDSAHSLHMGLLRTEADETPEKKKVNNTALLTQSQCKNRTGLFRAQAHRTAAGSRAKEMQVRFKAGCPRIGARG